MKAFKEGKLKSGSGAKVTNPKQAIAIGLSEAAGEWREDAATASKVSFGEEGAGQEEGSCEEDGYEESGCEESAKK